jgi:hypothetical protein
MKRGTLVAVLIFLGLLAATILYTRQADKASTEVTITPEPTVAYLVEVSEADIQSVTLVGPMGKVVVGRDESGRWKLEEPVNPAIDLGTMEMRITDMLNLEIQQVIAADIPDAQIGLDQPADTIEVALKNQTIKKFVIGSANQLGDGYYAREAGGKLVVLNKVSVDNLFDLINASYATATPTLAPAEGGSESTPEPATP